MTETWRPIPGWDGYYEVSDQGRVRSLARAVPGRPGVLIVKRDRMLTPMANQSGHLSVALCRDNRRTYMAIHRAVLLAFVGPCPGDMEGCHNDGNPANNHLANLRWDTHASNMVDKVTHGRHPLANLTHCHRGHAFDEANTYSPPGRGGRRCRECTRINKRARRERAAA